MRVSIVGILWLLLSLCSQGTYAACSTPAGIVSWWAGDGDALDSVGTNNGTLQSGALASAPGISGSAFTFDGTNGYVLIPDSTSLRPTNLSIEAWVRFANLNSAGNSPAGQQYIVFKQNSRTGSNFEGYSLTKGRRTGGDYLTFGVSSASGGAANVDAVSYVTTNVWYHVVAVRDTNAIRLYVNGNIEAQTSVSFPQDYGNYPLYFGTTGQPTWDHKLYGALDEVAIYNRALTAAEITALYQSGKCKLARIVSQPQSVTAGVGGSASLSVSATGSIPLTYQWRRNGTNLIDGPNVSGSTAATLNFSNLQTNDSSTLAVLVSNSVNVVTSATVSLFVDANFSGPIFTSQPPSQTVPAGSNATFHVAVTGSLPMTYQWRFNGVALTNSPLVSGVSTDTLSIGVVLPAHAGNYSVVVTNQLGAATSSVALLTVDLPVACVPPPTNLVGWWPGTADGRDLINTNNGILRGHATGTNFGMVGTAFQLDGTNDYVEVPNNPVLNPQVLTVECWVKFKNMDTPGNSTIGAQYIVFKQNTRTNVFEGYNLSKHRYAYDIIVWEVSSATGVPIQLNGVTSIQSNVWYHVAGVRGSNTMQLYINGQLEAEGSVNFAQDYGPYSLFFGTSNESYWDHKLSGMIDEVSLYNRPLTAAEIAKIYAVGAMGKCQAPQITLQPQNTKAVTGGSATLSVNAGGFGAIKYQWLFNGTNIAGATNSTLTLSNVTSATIGSYTVLVTDSLGSTLSTAAVVSLYTRPTLVNPKMTTNGWFTCTLTGDSGAQYVVEMATAIGTWTNLMTVSNATGQVIVTDATSTNAARMYRARVAP